MSIMIGYHGDVGPFHDTEALRAALSDLGALIAERGLSYEMCVVGGAAFLVQEPERQFATADVDVAARIGSDGAPTIEDVVPGELARAARDVASIHGLSNGWINGAVAASFGMILPSGFVERAMTETHGTLVVHFASRQDLLHLKTLAALQRRGDQGRRHLEDVKRAQPSREEIAAVVGAIRSTLTDPNVFHDRLSKIERELTEPLADA